MNQSEEVQYELGAMLKNIQAVENHLEWVFWRGYLRGAPQPHRIWEIGFKAEGRQWRLLGAFRGEKKAVLLVGCYHKGKVYTPPDAMDSAITRVKALKEGRATTNVREVQKDV